MNISAMKSCGRARRILRSHDRGHRRGRPAARILIGIVPVTVDEIRELAGSLPRSYEVFVRGQIKFRVGQIVWLALAPDGARMGCEIGRAHV